MFRRHLLIAATGFSLLALGSAALNLVVDPFWSFHGRDLFGLAEHRSQGSRAGKAEMLARGGHDVIILGSSRAEMGLDPADPSWGGASVYNASLAGTNLLETRCVYDHVLAHGGPRLVLLCADLLAFSSRRATSADFDTSLFNPELNALSYYCLSLIGYRSTHESFRALMRCSGAEARRVTWRNGHVRAVTASAGHHRRWFTNTIRRFSRDRQTYRGFRFGQDRVAAMRHIAESCRRRNVRLIIVISPVHAMQLETIRIMGLWGDFERMKREVVRAADDANALESTAPPVAAWDFTGFRGPLTESVPQDHEKDRAMKWFGDSSHFTPRLGSVVIARVLGAAEGPDDGGGFGFQLTRENLAGHLAGVRSDREAYAAGHPGEIEWIRRMLDEARGRDRAAGARRP